MAFSLLACFWLPSTHPSFCPDLGASPSYWFWFLWSCYLFSHPRYFELSPSSPNLNWHIIRSFIGIHPGIRQDSQHLGVSVTWNLHDSFSQSLSGSFTFSSSVSITVTANSHASVGQACLLGEWSSRVGDHRAWRGLANWKACSHTTGKLQGYLG